MTDSRSCEESPCAAADGKKSCAISADAAPFMPRKVVTSVLSPTAPEFYPQNYTLVPQPSEVENKPPTAKNDSDSTALNHVRRAIANMIERPGDFDSLVVPLSNTLASEVHDAETLVNVVTELMSQTMQSQNFRYTGARACWYLCQNLMLPSGSFENHLYGRCQSEFSNLCSSQERQELTDEEVSHLVGFTFFLAEFLDITKDCGYSSAFHMELPHKVAQLIMRLVELNQPSTLQAAVSILKLTGGILESRNISLSDIFFKLQNCTLESELVRVLVTSIMAMRDGCWGELGNTSVVTGAGAGDTRNAVPPTDEQGYFDGNSQVYGIDETEDFESYVGWSPNNAGSINPDNNVQYWIGDQVMDAETATAFEEFMAGNEPPPPVPNFWTHHQP